jgi:TolB-like protein
MLVPSILQAQETPSAISDTAHTYISMKVITEEPKDESADDIAFDSAFKRMAAKFSSADMKLKNKTVAVYGFDVNGRANDSFASYSTEKLTHEIVEAGKLNVVERSRIDRVMKEQQFSQSGLVDADSAARIGKLLAVDAVIIGTIRVTDTGIEFIARMVQSESGMIVSSADERLKSVAQTTSAGNNSSQGTDNSIAPGLSTDKSSYNSGDPITVKFSGMQGSAADWITLIKSTESDSTYGAWTYTNGAKSGSYTFKGVEPGDYEIRVYFDWPNGGYLVRKRIKIKIK